MLRAVTRALISPRRHVSWQLVAPFAILSLATAAAGTYMATSLVGGGVSDRFNAQLVEASRGVSDTLVRRERVHLEWLRSLAFTAGMLEATRAGSVAQLEPLVLPLASNTAAELVEVVRLDGSVAYGVELVDTRALRYQATEIGGRQWGPVLDVLEAKADGRGDKFSGVVFDGPTAWLVSAAPVEDGSELVGVAVVGTRLATLAHLAEGESFADVAFLDAAGRPLVSTLVNRGEGGVGVDELPPDLQPGALLDVQVGGRDYRLLVSATDVRGQPVGRTAVLLSTDLLAAAQDRTAVRMTAFFTVGFVLVVLLGFAVASQLTGAVSRLVGTTRRVTEGDLTARAQVDRADELGELGRSFNLMTDALREQLLGAVSALVSAIDARDAYTRGHSLRVGHLASFLGASLGMTPEQCHQLQVAGYLHDIGKIGVRDHVLLKPGPLTAEEREAIETHPVVGHEILSSVGLPEAVLAGVLGHHERLDGSGYPRGLSGDDVRLEARIVAVADVYDACVTDRPYRAGMPLDQVLRLLREEADRGRLDPTVVDRAHLVAANWERVWRNDARMSGFTLERVAPAPEFLQRHAV